MATELGKAYVQIMPSAQGISGSIKNAITPEAGEAGTSAGTLLGGNLAGAAKKLLLAAGIGAVLQKTMSSSLSEGAALQQSLGGIETLFKTSADKVKAYADEAYRTTGLSANAYMENVTGFSASLLQSLGGDTEKAADISNMAMIDMSDNANKMGTDMGLIQNAYQGFAKQNYTMLDNLKLGYGGTKKEMERLLADAEKITGVKYDINNLSDVYSAIHAIQGKLDITGTTAKEAASTFSGSFSAMKAAASNVLGKLALGQDIVPSLKSLVETTSTFLFDNFLPMVGNILKGLPTVISTIFTEAVPKLIEGGKTLLSSLGQGIQDNLQTFLETFQKMVDGMLEWITQNLPMFLDTGIKILTEIVNGILQSLPQLIETAGKLLSSFTEFFIQNLPVILEAGVKLLLSLIDGIIQNLPKIGESAIKVIGGFIDTLVQNLPKLVEKGWEILTSLVDGIIERLPDLIATAIQLIVDFTVEIAKKLPDIVSAGWDILKSLIQGIVEYIPKLLEKIGKMGSDIVEKVSKIDLWAAGQAIIDGFLGGLQGAWKGVTDFVGGIASWIGEHKGPISYDRKLLIPHGKAVMGGFQSGLEDKFSSVKDTVKSVATMVSDTAKKHLDLSVFDDDIVLDGSSVMSKDIFVKMQNEQLEQLRQNSVLGSDESTDEKDTIIEVHTTVELDGRVLGKVVEPIVTKVQNRKNKAFNRQRGEAW
ncbi:PblA [Carnobacteriaceae bacterium zg-ZUI78]|nr:PblA [Carnobacteriaceae bacterium zg-ZUI78]